MMRGRVLGSLVLCALVVLAAAITAKPATAQAVYCLNGATTTLPAEVRFAGGSAVLTESIAEFVITRTFDQRTFYVGIRLADGTVGFVASRPPPFDPGTLLEPGYSTNTVTRGACTAFVNLDRNFWLCYSRFQTDPGLYSRSEAIANYSAGMTVPFAVRDALSNTRLASGLYLVCNLPTGYTTQSGVAVSTGSGEMVQGDAALVSFVLGSMPLDYTRLAARA